MLATGFCDISPKFGLGPYSTIYSFNNLEGSRFQLGIRTTKDFSRKVRLMGYGAFGVKDGKFKAGGTFEYMFNNEQLVRKTYRLLFIIQKFAVVR